MFKGLKPILYGGHEVWPLVEGGKGVSATNHMSSGAWAAAGGIGTVSAVNADSYDADGQIVPQIYRAATRKDRHEELIRYAIDGAVEQVRRAYDVASGKGAININVLWEMGGAQQVLEGVLEKTRGLVTGVTCGAGMPYKLSEIAARHNVNYLPIISSARAFRALWKRAYSKVADLMAAVVYEDPWLAGGHNGLSNAEDPRKPEDPYPRVKALRDTMRAEGISRGMIADAIDQWLACGDVAEAAALMSTIAMPMVAEGALDRLADWLDRLPLAQIVAVPELARARRWLSLLRAEAPDAVILPAGAEGECLSLLRRVYGDDCSEKAVEACNGLLSEPRHLPDFAADMVRTAIAQGALRRGLFGLVHEAIRPVMLRRRGTASDLAGALAICAKAGAARAQGQLGEAERVLREAKMQQSRSGLAAALVDAALARAYYERDALDAAAELANGALPHLERSLFQDAIIPAYLVAIRIAAGRGQGDAAASLIDRAELIAFERDWAPLKALCVVERARLRLPATIDPESVVAVDDEEAAVRDPLSASGRAFALLAEMRAYEAIANGDRSRLTLLADRLLHLAANGDDAELRAAATLFNILPQLSGRCDKMVELETVRFLNHAAASGFRRTIVDVLDVTGVRAVQNFCSEAYASDCFLALLKLAEPSRRNPALEGAHRAAPGEAFSFLTEREIEILSALNAGESNKEIARTLHLAPETVKWHLKNVMRKLRATSREEAVANAATLGLKLIEARAVS